MAEAQLVRDSIVASVARSYQECTVSVLEAKKSQVFGTIFWDNISKSQYFWDNISKSQ